MRGARRSLALILHAHLPFVRHPEHAEFFEEDWLFEAISESYIPLLVMMQRLAHDGVPFQLALNLTPPLCAMLDDELLRARYRRHLDRTIRLAEREMERTRDEPPLQQLARAYYESFSEIRRQYVAWDCDLLAVCRQLRDAGVLELVASAATHGLLPLLVSSPEAVRAQVAIGCDVYRQYFQADPVGFWLPECAYVPGLEKILQQENLRWFVVDAHAFALASPRPRRALYAPSFTSAGPGCVSARSAIEPAGLERGSRVIRANRFIAISIATSVSICRPITSSPIRRRAFRVSLG